MSCVLRLTRFLLLFFFSVFLSLFAAFLCKINCVLITNGKLYTGLVPYSLILNDLERQNRGFCGFFGDFRL